MAWNKYLRLELIFETRESWNYVNMGSKRFNYKELAN